MSWASTRRGRLCASKSARECSAGEAAFPSCLAVLASNSLPPSRQLQFSPEEVLGMVLNYSRSLAEDFAGEQPR